MFEEIIILKVTCEMWEAFSYIFWKLSLNTSIFHENYCEYGDMVIFLAGNLLNEQSVSPFKHLVENFKENIIFYNYRTFLLE